MKKSRLITAIIMALLVLLMVVPALAEEGGGSMNVSPGEDEPPPVVADPTEPPVTDPTDPPPTTDPTDEPAPTDAPTDEPGPTDTPTDEPGPTDEPTGEPGPTDEPTADPSADPSAEPTEEPTEEPTPEPPIDNEPSGGNDNNQGSATRPSVNMGGGIRQPSTSSRRPSSSSSRAPEASGSSGSQAPIDDGPQYVTFARVTQKSNAMSRTLFYSGAACVGTGVLGLIVLVVFMVRGRRGDDREEIIAEIEQSAVRQAVRPQVRRQQPQPVQPPAYEEDDPYAQYDRQQGYGYSEEPYEDGGYTEGSYDRSYAQGYDAPAPSLHRPEPEDLAVPVNGSMYTEEFELPPQDGGFQPEPLTSRAAAMYTEEFEPPRQVPAPPARGPIMPTQAAMYTEEFTLPEEMSQPPAPKPAPRPAQHQAPRHAAPRGPQPASKVPPEQMDTTELLREILHGDDK